MMKSSVFIRGNLTIVMLAGMFVGTLFFSPAYAVELVGQPVTSTAAVQEGALQVVNTGEAPTKLAPVATTVMPLPAVDISSQHDDIRSDALVPLVAMVAVVAAILGVLILVIVLANFHYRDKARRAENINLNIDKLLAAGRDIPIELLRGDELRSDDENSMGGAQIIRDDLNLHKGIKNLCVGIGLLIFLTFLCGIEVGAVGFVVIGLGVSRLLVWKLSGVKSYSTRTQS